VTNNVFLDKKVNTQQQQQQQQQNKKIKHKKNPCRRRKLNTGPLAPKVDLRNHCTTESTESIDCSQAVMKLY